MKDYDIIIVGAGIAGLRAVEQVREVLPQATIALLSEEDRLPYKRTKISKNIASGFTDEQFALHQSEWYRGFDIDLYTDSRVTVIDTGTYSLHIDNGEDLSWKRLVLTTGARSIIPDPYRDLPHHQVYFAADAHKLSLISPGRALVLGTGVLGLETADQLWRKGHVVTIAGQDSRLMAKQLNKTASLQLQRTLENAGVNILFLQQGKSIESGEYDSLTLCTGTVARSDIRMDLDYEGGFLVDQYMCTSHPDVFAGGDGAQMPGGYQSHLWHAAEFSGMAAGRNAALSLKGEELQVYSPQAWRLKCEVFDQYYFSINYSPDLEAAGLDKVEQQQGDIYRCFWFKDNKIHSIIMINEKERAKWYQKAVQDGVGKDEFLKAVIR